MNKTMHQQKLYIGKIVPGTPFIIPNYTCIKMRGEGIEVKHPFFNYRCGYCINEIPLLSVLHLSRVSKETAHYPSLV